MANLKQPFGHCSFREVRLDSLAKLTKNDVHLLDQSAKDRLLMEPNYNTASEGESELLLERLRNLAPTVADQFQSRPRGFSDLVFRLVNDRGSAEPETSYIALSYRWKNIEANKVIDEGTTNTTESAPPLLLPTTATMFQAILCERESAREGLWFDQVCINQEDETEKAISIGAMDTIYKRARLVVVALDDIELDDDDTSLLQRYAEELGKAFGREDPKVTKWFTWKGSPGLQRDARWPGILNKILTAEWFERAWCGHEYRLGRSVLFLIPCIQRDGLRTFARFTSPFLTHVAHLVDTIHGLPSLFTTPGISTKLRVLLINILDHSDDELGRERKVKDQQRHKKNVSASDEAGDLISAVNHVFTLKTGGNPRLPPLLRENEAFRDKISITLNSSNCGLILRPATTCKIQYNTNDQCYEHLLLLGLAARDPLALCTTGPLLKRNGTFSWLCRPQLSDQRSSSNKYSRFPVQSKFLISFDTENQFIQLDLFFLCLSPLQCQITYRLPDRFLQRSEHFVKECKNRDLIRSIITKYSEPNAIPTAEFGDKAIKILSCILTCRAESWTEFTGNIPVSRFDTQSLLHAIDWLLDETHDIEQDWDQDFGNKAGYTLLDFVTSFDKMPGQGSIHTSVDLAPLVLTSAAGHQAISFGPIDGNFELAVPDALKSCEYQNLKRCWILRKRCEEQESEQWTLLAKTKVIATKFFLEEICTSQDSKGQQLVYASSHG
jgi:hypothetical protein